MRHILLLSIASLFISTSYATPKIISSIYPLQQIANHIAGSPTELIANSPLSPHHYAIKPADARLIQEADIVLWIGASMMPQLQQYIDKRHDKVTIIAAQLKDIKLIESDHQHEHHEEEHHEHEHEATHQYDPHLWLSPDNAITIAKALTQQLIALDPEKATQYQSNLATFSSAVKETQSLILGNFESIQLPNYFIFHDAYAYFEEAFGIKHTATIKAHAGQTPKTRHLHDIKKQLTASAHACLFKEPQFNSPIIDTLGKSDHVAIYTLDPVGYEKTLSAGYPAILRNLANTILQCKNTP